MKSGLIWALKDGVLVPSPIYLYSRNSTSFTYMLKSTQMSFQETVFMTSQSSHCTTSTSSLEIQSKKSTSMAAAIPSPFTRRRSKAFVQTYAAWRLNFNLFQRDYSTLYSQPLEKTMKSFRHEAFTEYVPAQLEERWLSQRPYVENGVLYLHNGSMILEGIAALHEALIITSGPCSFGSIIIPDNKQVLISKWSGEQSIKGFNAWRFSDMGKGFRRL